MTNKEKMFKNSSDYNLRIFTTQDTVHALFKTSLHSCNKTIIFTFETFETKKTFWNKLSMMLFFTILQDITKDMMEMPLLHQKQQQKIKVVTFTHQQQMF